MSTPQIVALVWSLLAGLALGFALVFLNRITVNVRRIHVELHQLLELYHRPADRTDEGERPW